MSKKIPIFFPKETQEGTESFLSKWLKQAGNSVSLHEPIAEISTDKVIVEVSSPATGTLVEILVKENEKIEPGQQIASIDQSSISSSPAEATLELSPAVKRLLKEHSLHPAQISGSGKGGRITVEDVEEFVKGQSTATAKASRIPHTPMRKTIAKKLSDSLLKTAPHVTTVFECDVSGALLRKETLLQNGIKTTLTPFFIRAIADAVSVVPEVNSRWNEDYLEVFEDVNVGVGTATMDGGLVVPVLKGVQKLSIEEIAKLLDNILPRARDNNLAKEDIIDGTITISNHGMGGSLFAAPIIIHQPQSAILGIGKVEKRAKVVSLNGADQIEIRPCAFMTLTIDHRVLDGFRANEFMRAFVSSLEQAI